MSGVWDVSAVSRWLEQSGFEDLAQLFVKEKIDGGVLHGLTLSDLQQLKVPLGQAKKLLEAIAELKAHQRMGQPRSTWSAGDIKRLPPLLSVPTDVEPSSNCQIILLMGPPGSGKSTLGDRLAEILGGEHFDLGVQLRSGSKISAQSALLNFLFEAMDKGKKKMGLGPHLAFVNGYPRQIDGFNFWEELDKVVKPSLVLILEAPDDVLQVRLMERGRTDEQPFQERMAYYRAETDPVITAYHDTGRTRYVDSTGSMDFVVASALFHLQTAVVFACGKPDKYGKVCNAVVEMGLPYQVSCFNVDEISSSESSEAVVKAVMNAVKAKPGQVILLKGFPRNSADLQVWESRQFAEVLLALDFESDMDFSGYLSRRLKDEGPVTVEDVSKLIQSCQPLHVAAPFAATALLKNWMDASRYAQWWDNKKVQEFQGIYTGYMKSQALKHKKSPSLYVRPSESPPLEAWLIWLAHLLHASQYTQFCGAYLSRTIGPLPPPISAGLTQSLAKTKFEKITSGWVKLGADALASVPLAFVDGLSSLHNAGLYPLCDPRALCLGASMDGGVANELMKLLGLFYRRFLIIMGEAGEDSKAGPSAEMDWIWHAHTTHPSVYADDCRRLFGHVIPHIPCKRSDAPPPGDPDSGQVAMGELNKLMRSKLKAFASREVAALKEANLWPFRKSMVSEEAEDNVITLGCFIPGGDRQWLASKLALVGSDVGEALSRSLKDPDDWVCPRSSDALQRDPDLVEVIVRLLSGETLFEQVMSRDTKIAEVERLLRSTKGEREQLKFFVDGEELATTTAIGDTSVVSGSIISLVRVKKPKPKPKPVVTRRAISPDSDDWRCTCFTNACIFHILKSGKQVQTVQRSMQDLQEGDMVLTGAAKVEDQYRRVTRIWRCPVPTGIASTVELQPGCRLTTGHPVHLGGKQGRWCRPESIGTVEETQEKFVYTLELEGHVDTVLVGRDKQNAMLCAALGVYCGESFGWNLFTRKTLPCDVHQCRKCDVAVVKNLNFAAVTPDMLAIKYAPY